MLKMHTIAGLGLTALVLAGGSLGGTTQAGGRDDAAADRLAGKQAGSAAKALAKGDAARAVAAAEAAVALRPQDAGYRLLLGQSYLKSGRFSSAHQAFADVLSLDPANGKAALNLALSQIAEGRWDAARTTLADHAGTIPARDRGLAISLAGDPANGVAVLMDAARQPGADARTRQNLGLALALAGHWREAKAVIDVDVTPEQSNARILQWIGFARPTNASDQVAALLGVTAVEDAGQPVSLALVAPAAVTQMAAVAPVSPVVPTMVPEAAAVVPTTQVVAMRAGGIAFGPRREVVQPLPSMVMAAQTIPSRGAFKTRLAAIDAPIRAAPALVAARAPAKGGWFVQLGAYDSVGVARDAWGRATRRYAAFRNHAPTGMVFAQGDERFYRLSVGGFARNDAAAMCRSYRARGGACFIRTGAGDQMARWTRPARVQLASR